jgi:hypothetical protein
VLIRVIRGPFFSSSPGEARIIKDGDENSRKKPQKNTKYEKKFFGYYFARKNGIIDNPILKKSNRPVVFGFKKSELFMAIYRKLIFFVIITYG